ncbi:MAG TPA: hypothetical protein VGI12_19050 [Vicinamibacterales bacterium]|jgi:hypothetical protein
MLKSFAAACLAAIVTVPMAAQSNMAQPEKFTAFAVDTSTMTPRAGTAQVDITINRWSTDADRTGLIEILRSKGQDALLEALQKMPVVGFINTPGSLRYDLHFARQIPQPEGGRRIVLGTDRYIGSWEAANHPRTVDYPFTVIELQLDKNGLGKGWASIYTKVTATESGNVELENFTNEPVMLNEVHPVK